MFSQEGHDLMLLRDYMFYICLKAAFLIDPLVRIGVVFGVEHGI